MEQRFFICKHCGNIIAMVSESGVPVVCCGEEMTELKANTVDAAKEKHVPVYTQTGETVTVRVGSADHPMVQAHHIAWIALQTKEGLQIKKLDPTGEPKATFKITESDKVEAVYAYCNLHGLWKA